MSIAGTVVMEAADDISLPEVEAWAYILDPRSER